MQLKRIMIALSLLGLISGPIHAASSKTTKVTTKREHAHQTEHALPSLEELGAEPTALGANSSCGITHYDLILYSMTQSFARAMPTPCSNHFNSLDISGGINVDVGKWYDHHTHYQGENYNHFALNDAYLNVGARVNPWTEALVSLSYGNPTGTYHHYNLGYEYSSVYPVDKVNLEQAYFTIANFEESPLFLQFGKQFQDFSRYDIHPITRSMTQVLSETLSTDAKVGFIVPMGINGAVYAFDNTLAKYHHHNHEVNYGASLGIDQPGDFFGWDLGVGYMHNLISAQDVAHAVSRFTGTWRYHRSVGGLAVYADVNTGPFYFSARATTAMKHFNYRDLPRYGASNLVAPHVVYHNAHGAKPWAYGAQMGFNFDRVLFFPCCQKTQNLYLGYQHSHQAVAIGLPQSRWLAGYNIDVLKGTNFAFEWNRDYAYAKSRGGQRWAHNNVYTIRTAVQFG